MNNNSLMRQCCANEGHIDTTGGVLFSTHYNVKSPITQKDSQTGAVSHRYSDLQNDCHESHLAACRNHSN